MKKMESAYGVTMLSHEKLQFLRDFKTSNLGKNCRRDTGNIRSGEDSEKLAKTRHMIFFFQIF